MKKRRELRYKFEATNYAVFGYEKEKKEMKTIYKGLINSKSIEPRERKLEALDHEYEEKVVNRQSTVDKPLVAAEHEDMNKNHIGRQSHGVERNINSFDGTRDLTSETDSTNLIEEAQHFIWFGKSFTCNAQVDHEDPEDENHAVLIEEMVNQRSSKEVEQKCGSSTFNHDSTVDEPLVAAEHEDMNKNHIGRQSQGVGRNIILDHGTKCLNPEAVQFTKSEEFCSFPIDQVDFDFQSMKREAIWERIFILRRVSKTTPTGNCITST
jgi:hypothetical protein